MCRALLFGSFCLALLAPGRSAAAQDPVTVPEVVPDTFTAFGPIYFDAGRHSIRGDAVPFLERMLRWLRINPGMRFRVEGYSDQRGPEEANLRVSRRRAEAAVRWFTARGIARSRFDVVAYGETRPQCDQADRACAPSERRAEFRVVTYGANRMVRPREELPPR